jgi:hypothetical protein
MKRWWVLALPALFCIVSCQKEYKEEKINTPIPFLTGKKWTSDTITINPPLSYNQLSAEDQRSYRNALAWFKNAQLIFNADGSVVSDQGDWDFGYNKWTIINNNADIEVILANRAKDTLYNWKADGLRFSYSKSVSPFFDGTFIFK